MPRRLNMLVMPILVTALDVAWGWSLATYAKPWFFEMLASERNVSMFYGKVIEPKLLVGYLIVLALQLIWVNLIANRPYAQARLRLCWWLGCALIIVSSIVLRQGLTLPAGPAFLLLGVQVGDLLLLYWLATRLLTPLPQRSVIPGWW
jgi:hypothetical protein